MMELKPCPFCGGNAEVVNTTECYGHGDYGQEVFIQCKKCHASAASISNWDVPNREDRLSLAADKWNMRSQKKCK